MKEDNRNTQLVESLHKHDVLMRRTFLATIGWTTARLIMPGNEQAAGRFANLSQARKPNVILIMTDDQGYGDLGCHGNQVIRTPNLDRLHAESVRLTNFHVAPCCSPTRAQLMTGRYATRTGVWHTVAGRSLLQRDEVTMADVFKANGYRTGIFGKWHLGDSYPYRPQDRGFEEVLIHGGGGIGNIPDYWCNDYFDDTYFRNGRPEQYRGYCTDVWFREALHFIETNRDRPFFCYLPTNAPHLPYVAPDRYKQLYTQHQLEPGLLEFYSMITCIDDNVGLLRNRLEQLGLQEDTILIFMTDNGSSRGYWAKTSYNFNAHMRGGKTSPYEGGHRVPFFIYWPKGSLVGGKDIPSLTAGFDVLPTLMDLCGLTRQAGPPVDGLSLAPLFRGKTESFQDRILFVDSQRATYPIKWRNSAVMTERWRLVNGQELYDMYDDPAQTRDVAGGNTEIVHSLRNSYEAWWNSLSPALDRYCEISLGADEQNPTLLTAHDVFGAAVWSQDQVLAGKWCDGFWAVDVVKSGLYEFRLRRWPTETDAQITGGLIIPPELKSLTYHLPGYEYALKNDRAQSLSATYARLKIDSYDVISGIQNDAVEVKFRLPLRAGSDRLQAWFIDDRNNGATTGVYYVYVERL